ncbi:MULTISPECIES: hypothetical protein [unclassified Nocardioides]|uniref:hypothetical protein n=1 Tax=unclassified Nocardioides TaxID=2615069 RepID=UPI0012E3B43A|nr:MULTISPECIES: hypothetical protein [unclassified Nocardioides]
MDDGWNTLAGAGFALAAISLSWQLWFAVRVDRARLKVRAREMQIYSQGTPPLDVVAMTVTNAGRRATVLQSVHLTLGKHTMLDRLWSARIRPKRWRGTKSILPFASNELSQLNAAAALPKRLEPGDEVTVYLQTGHVRQALHDARMNRFHALASSSTAGSKASRSVRMAADARRSQAAE